MTHNRDQRGRRHVFGSRNTHWVAATIDASNPRVFAFEPRIVAANVDP